MWMKVLKTIILINRCRKMKNLKKKMYITFLRMKKITSSPGATTHIDDQYVPCGGMEFNTADEGDRFLTTTLTWLHLLWS